MAETTAEKIAVMQAYVEGKEIQFCESGKETWLDLNLQDSEPRWNWERCDYRVKPKPREWWFVDVYQSPLFDSREAAEEHRQVLRFHGMVIHVLEVLED
jgi:hypothetical protein